MSSLFKENKFFILLFVAFLSFGLTACNETSKVAKQKTYTISGHFFGTENDEAVMLANYKGDIQKRVLLSDAGEYEFNLTEDEVLKGPFYAMYSYGDTPKIDGEPPFIKVKILPENEKTYLPAVLVFKFDFAPFEDTIEKSKLFFNWNKPVFSNSNGSQIELYCEVANNFPFFGSKEIHVNTFNYETTNGSANLLGKIKGDKKKRLLCDLIKHNCKNTVWYLKLRYTYPEGTKLVYASNPIKIDVCDKCK